MPDMTNHVHCSKGALLHDNPHAGRFAAYLRGRHPATGSRAPRATSFRAGQFSVQVAGYGDNLEVYACREFDDDPTFGCPCPHLLLLALDMLTLQKRTHPLDAELRKAAGYGRGVTG